MPHDPLNTPDQQDFFFAYAYEPRSRAEVVAKASEILSKQGKAVTTWQNLEIAGKIIIDRVLSAIDAARNFVAEISNINPNVLFEAGYALASGKNIFFVIDGSDDIALQNWKAFSLVSSVGYINHEDNSSKLADELYKASSSGEPILTPLLTNAPSREENVVFSPRPPYRTNSVDQALRVLERDSSLKIIGAQEEIGLAQLDFYVSQIYRSSAAVFHFVKPSRNRAELHNARTAFLAGIAHGFRIPVLLIAEKEYESPLDYQEMLKRYETVGEVAEIVTNWKEKIPSPEGTNKRLGRFFLKTELPITSFGQYVAESEEERLTKYFVTTSSFNEVLDGSASIFIGRKGTGKTATMLQAVDDLKKDRRNLVVSVKPGSYELNALIALVKRYASAENRDRALKLIWTHFLTFEVAIGLLNEVDELPAGIGGSESLVELENCIERVGIDRKDDVATRLENLLYDAKNFSPDNSLSQKLLSEINQVTPPLRIALQNYSRVALFIDNLDKNWQAGADFDDISYFILALLSATGSLISDFQRRRNNIPAVKLTVTTFLRTDIYDAIALKAREPDKINPKSIEWRDRELLITVLEDRYKANRQKGRAVDSSGLWSELMSPEVRSVPTRDYILWRILPRPRDLIYLAGTALSIAQNRRHEIIEENDILYAEEQYSQFAIEAFLVESQAQGFDVTEVITNMSGLDAILPKEILEDILVPMEDPEMVEKWLLQTGFLGIETARDHFDHVSGSSTAERYRDAAFRRGEREGWKPRYRIHPAFRPYLLIPDSDLHT